MWESGEQHERFVFIHNKMLIFFPNILHYLAYNIQLYACDQYAAGMVKVKW